MDQPKLDQLVQTLQEHKDAWATLPIPRKIEMLVEVRRRLGERAEAWVEACVQGKQMDPRSPWVGEEWTTGPWAMAVAINGYLETLRALSAGKLPRPRKVFTLPNGQLAAEIFPGNVYDFLLLNGITAEVWMQPGVTRENLAEHMATFYRQEHPAGKVALVLGAGNVASIAPRDALYRLYAMGHVVLLKMNPVNDYLGPILEDIFAPFIDGGFLRFAYGGADVGKYLTPHPGVDEIHMTGSARTYQTIVYGPGPEGAERKRRKQPILKKPITSELGGVGPTILLPGKWSRADIRFQAENVVTMKLHNNGYNCVASQVLVLWEGWEQRDEFLEAVRDLLRAVPPRKAYYPGAAERQKEAVAIHPEAELLGDEVPRTLITGLDPQAAEEYCFTTEFFGAVLAEVSLPGKDADEFLENAVHFCNEKLYGTLGATIIAHPRTIKALGPAFGKAVADLHYGSVGINIWDAAAFMLAQSAWGAYPYPSGKEVGSGVGVVGNCYLFDQPEKTVIRGSFHPFPRTWLNGNPAFLPKPPWFITNKTAHTTSKGVAIITIDPSVWRLPALIWSAFRG
jgi:aldehyde dehydrogenase (NAD(P)+)